MPRIYVQFSGLDRIESQCGIIATKIDDIRSDLKGTIKKLDWDVRYESDIDGTADRIAKKLDGYEEALKNYKKFIEDARREYVKLDEYDSEKTGLLEALKGGISTYIEDWKTGAEIIKTSISNCVSAIAEDYESKGALYRFVNGALGLAKAVGGGLTVAGAILGTGVTAGMGAPATVLVGAYGANTAISGITDFWNALTGDVDAIGNVNVLNSFAEGVCGQAGEWLGNREIGESVGHAVYTAGEIFTIALSLEKFVGKIKEAHSYADTLGESAAKAKDMIAKAAKELPETIKKLGNIDVAKVTTIPSQIAQITSSTPAINAVISDVALINSGVEKGSKLINKGIDIVNTLSGHEIILLPNGYESAFAVNDTIGDVSGSLDGAEDILDLMLKDIFEPTPFSDL